MSPSGHRLLDVAQRQMQLGQFDSAIQNLVAYLGENPDSAHAHAILAICLCQRHRLTTAAMEAAASLRSDPMDPFAHLASGLVQQARRAPKKAEAHFRAAMELNPSWSWPVRELARLCLYWGRIAEARNWIVQARALDPEDADTAVLEAEVQLQSGDSRSAEATARLILASDPSHVDALCVLGYALLRQGRSKEALEHAIWAVRNAPAERAPLRLLVAVKMRRNPLTGLWWGINSFFSGGSGTRIVTSLLGVYLGYRVLTLVLEDFGQANMATALGTVWMGFCVYTWVAPLLFQHALKKELARVRLSEDF